MLIVESRPGRLVRLGVLQPWHEIARRELVSEGVADQQIETLNGKANGVWATARLVDGWLAEHADDRIVVFCDRFQSELLADVYDSEVDRMRRSRVAFVGLTDRRYDENDWWKSKVGIKAFFEATVDLIYVRMLGERPERRVKWDPEQYEEALLGQD